MLPQAIADALRKNTTLQLLDLGHNEVAERGAMVLARRDTPSPLSSSPPSQGGTCSPF